MKVYHGTSEKYLKSILKNGLIPRGEKDGNWKHSEEGHSEYNYLTSVYAGYFALSAIDDYEKERLMLIEVDLDKLDKKNFRPDEDFIAQSISQSELDKDLLDINEEKYRHAWKLSLNHMGTMAYKGKIPKSAIVRIVLVKFHYLLYPITDPVISILNFKLMNGRYAAYTKILLGDKITWNEFKKKETFFAKLTSSGFFENEQPQWFKPFYNEQKKAFEKMTKEIERETIWF